MCSDKRPTRREGGSSFSSGGVVVVAVVKSMALSCRILLNAQQQSVSGTGLAIP